MRRRLALLAFCLGLLPLALGAGRHPRPQLKIYPSCGNCSYYDTDVTPPLCTWRCLNGKLGSSTAPTSDFKCKQACQASCGGTCFAV